MLLRRTGAAPQPVVSLLRRCEKNIRAATGRKRFPQARLGRSTFWTRLLTRAALMEDFMNRTRGWRFALVGLGLVGLALGMRGNLARVQAQIGPSLLGGPQGVVRSTRGDQLEGIGVQLVSSKTAIRTTVYTNDQGRYEFPKLEAGSYTLRITRPLEFRPYLKDSVTISGATALGEMVLEPVAPNSDYLPPTPEILAQLSGTDWLENLDGTAQEKRVFSLACGNGCHSYQQIFRNRYDEQ